MPTLACSHQDVGQARRVCLHLLVRQAGGYCKWFIGGSTTYDLAYMCGMQQRASDYYAMLRFARCGVIEGRISS